MNIQRQENDEMVESYYDSSNIFKSLYFKESKKLSIFFRTGGVYTYLDVSLDTFELYDNVDSQGTYLNKYIKPKHKVDKNFTMKDFEIKQLTETVINIKKLILDGIKQKDKENEQS
jgi:hypothetical protein